MENNVKFAEKSYWDARFDEEEEYEWFGLSFDDLLPTLINLNILQSEKCLNNKGDDDDEGYLKSVLMLGTGNSRLPVEMALPPRDGHRSGFLYVTGVDFSEVALQHMKQRSEEVKDRVEWLVTDLRAMPIRPDSFDIIIEKGTLDVFFVGEKDPWNISKSTTDTVSSIVSKVYEMLPVGGVFVSISFAQPHFRLPFLIGNGLQWSVDCRPIRGKCSEFDYFAYTASKCGNNNCGSSDVVKAVDAVLKRSSRSNGAELMRLRADDDDNGQYLTQLVDNPFA